MSASQMALALLQAMTVDMQTYILLDSKVSDREFANQMIGHLDGLQQRELQSTLEAVQVEPTWNQKIRDSVDALLAQAGYAPDSSARNQLACMNFDTKNAVQVEPVATVKVQNLLGDEFLPRIYLDWHKPAVNGMKLFAAPQEAAVNAELLEALQNLVANQDTTWCHAGFNEEQIKAMPYLMASRESIKKATGETA